MQGYEPNSLDSEEGNGNDGGFGDVLVHKSKAAQLIARGSSCITPLRLMWGPQPADNRLSTADTRKTAHTAIALSTSLVASEGKTERCRMWA